MRPVPKRRLSLVGEEVPVAEEEPGLRRLFLFDAVCRTGGIGQAASSVGLSQPAVSQAIVKLEACFDSVLLDRRHSGSVLTQQGVILHRRVRRMQDQMVQAVAVLLNGSDVSSPLVSRICRNLTDAQIRCHIAIAQTGSAAEAARRLRISQPAVHRAARELEYAVQVALYRRRVHGVSVTGPGMEFARRLHLALYEITQAFEDLSAARGQIRGRVSVGVLPLVPRRWLARAMGRLLRLYPDAVVSLWEGAHGRLLADLQFGTIDVMVGALRDPRLRGNVVEIDLFSDPYVVVVRRGHRLAGRTAITGRDLAECDWVVPHRDMPRRAVVEAMLATLPRRPRVVVETSSLAMMTATLTESDSVTLLSRSQILQEDWGRDLAALAVGVPDGRRTVGMTMRQDWLATPVQQAFIDLLSQESLLSAAPNLS